MNPYNDINDLVSEYMGSEYFFILDPSCKEHIEVFLHNFLNEAKKEEDFPESWTSYQMKTAFRNVAKLMNVSLEVKQSFVYMFSEFLEYLNHTATDIKSDIWLEWLFDFRNEYAGFFREDGSIKGESIKFEVTKVKRNDPCPCGSGKKFKKCCG